MVSCFPKEIIKVKNFATLLTVLEVVMTMDCVKLMFQASPCMKDMVYCMLVLPKNHVCAMWCFSAVL